MPCLRILARTRSLYGADASLKWRRDGGVLPEYGRDRRFDRLETLWPDLAVTNVFIGGIG